jgi:hypothetical protein
VAGYGCRSGFEDDLLAVVLLVLEHLEAAAGLFQRQRVGDDPGRVELQEILAAVGVLRCGFAIGSL